MLICTRSGLQALEIANFLLTGHPQLLEVSSQRGFPTPRNSIRRHSDSLNPLLALAVVVMQCIRFGNLLSMILTGYGRTNPCGTMGLGDV